MASAAAVTLMSDAVGKRRELPIERDNKIVYRIKSQGETFERTVEEHQLSRAA